MRGTRSVEPRKESRGYSRDGLMSTAWLHLFLDSRLTGFFSAFGVPSLSSEAQQAGIIKVD